MVAFETREHILIGSGALLKKVNQYSRKELVHQMLASSFYGPELSCGFSHKLVLDHPAFSRLMALFSLFKQSATTHLVDCSLVEVTLSLGNKSIVIIAYCGGLAPTGGVSKVWTAKLPDSCDGSFQDTSESDAQNRQLVPYPYSRVKWYQCRLSQTLFHSLGKSMVVQLPTAPFLFPCACQHGIVAQALTLNGSGFNSSFLVLRAGHLSLWTFLQYEENETYLTEHLGKWRDNGSEVLGTRLGREQPGHRGEEALVASILVNVVSRHEERTLFAFAHFNDCLCLHQCLEHVTFFVGWPRRKVHATWVRGQILDVACSFLTCLGIFGCLCSG